MVTVFAGCRSQIDRSAPGGVLSVETAYESGASFAVGQLDARARTRCGVWRFYYPDGRLMFVVGYNASGLLDGPALAFHLDGSVDVSSTTSFRCIDNVLAFEDETTREWLNLVHASEANSLRHLFPSGLADGWGGSGLYVSGRRICTFEMTGLGTIRIADTALADVTRP